MMCALSDALYFTTFYAEKITEMCKEKIVQLNKTKVNSFFLNFKNFTIKLQKFKQLNVLQNYLNNPNQK